MLVHIINNASLQSSTQHAVSATLTNSAITFYLSKRSRYNYIVSSGAGTMDTIVIIVLEYTGCI